MARRVVTVFGSSHAPPEGALYRDAQALGRCIAEAGWVLCNGGYGGTMEAAARGAVQAGGHTIGVTCTALGRSGPNPFIRQEVPTFDLLARLNTLIRLGHAYVVLPGGTGTLLELAAVWELRNKSLLRRASPVVLLGGFWSAVERTIRAFQPDALALQVADSPEQAVALIRRQWEQARQPDPPQARCNGVSDEQNTE